MDKGWERTIGFVHVSLQETGKLFCQFDPTLTLYETVPVSGGCRNTNYRVETSRGPFLLRFYAEKDAAAREEAVSVALQRVIAVPKLLFHGNRESGEAFSIYEYIAGTPLSVLLEEGACPAGVARQAGKSAALIHRCRSTGNFSTLADFPPFSGWYDFFIDNPRLQSRIGGGTAARVKALVRGMQDSLTEISQHTGFTHADFRPANMLLDRNQALWILDWEFAGYGHTLADLGQFFRYRTCFSPEAVDAFAAEYESISGSCLPPRWFDLAKLRDLVNPLQLLCGVTEATVKYGDLNALVLDTLHYFGY